MALVVGDPMGTAGWVGWIIALVVIAALVIVIVWISRRPESADAKLQKAITDARDAQKKAQEREVQLTKLYEDARKELARIGSIRDERQRLTALAQFANRMRGTR